MQQCCAAALPSCYNRFVANAEREGGARAGSSRLCRAGSTVHDGYLIHAAGRLVRNSYAAFACLQDSVGALTSLTMLVLQGCKSLETVPVRGSFCFIPHVRTHSVLQATTSWHLDRHAAATCRHMSHSQDLIVVQLCLCRPPSVLSLRCRRWI